MKLTRVAGLTDPGRVRRRNEDAFVCEPPLFSVADGMGGAQAGEVASRLAAATFRDFHDADALDPEARLRSIIQEANRRIYARAASDPHASGMGTTVTAALVTGTRVAVGHVGDSRAYRLRGGALEQLTSDHSLVAELVRSGRLTPEEAEKHPHRAVITRTVGTDQVVEVDTITLAMEEDDLYLLCSDGLTDMVSDDDVRALGVAAAGDPGVFAATLVEAANAGGGDDNITVVVFEIVPDEPGGRRPPPAAAAEPEASTPDGSSHQGPVAPAHVRRWGGWCSDHLFVVPRNRLQVVLATSSVLRVSQMSSISNI